MKNVLVLFHCVMVLLQPLRQPDRGVFVFPLMQCNTVRTKAIPFSKKPFNQELKKKVLERDSMGSPPTPILRDISAAVSS